MGAEEAAPCRHAGGPLPEVVEAVSQLILGLGRDEASLLAKHGLSVQEYMGALPDAIQRVRGSMSASTANRKEFLKNLFEWMRDEGFIQDLEIPKYGKDTVYKLTVADLGDVAIIQKGCPDGAHSSLNWSVPEWAAETYLWWMCDSMAAEPGEHVVRGVNRLRNRFFNKDYTDAVDGVIFHNDLCGTAKRFCPKVDKTITIDGSSIPVPCIYVMPERVEAVTEWNWSSDQRRAFPAVLLGAFGVEPDQVRFYTGNVGFQNRAGSLHNMVVSRFGPGRVTTFRN